MGVKHKSQRTQGTTQHERFTEVVESRRRGRVEMEGRLLLSQVTGSEKMGTQAQRKPNLKSNTSLLLTALARNLAYNFHDNLSFSI